MSRNSVTQLIKIQMNQQVETTFQNTVIPESKKFLNERSNKQFRISIQVISETSLDQQIVDGLSQQQKIQAVLELKSIHLEWLNIKKIQNLEVFTNLNILYLQHNKIAKIQNLECLKNLQYLALNDNLLSRVEGLLGLKKISGLNLNNNQIQDLEADQLPQSLQLLSFRNNPVTFDANYKVDIIKRLPILQMLDDHVITAEERLKIIGKFPQHLIQYSQKMKQFRNKQKIKQQLQQQQKGEKPLYLGGNVDENEALREIRQKTKKFMQEAQQAFKIDIEEQNKNFQSKIKVSKKIRDFKTQNANKKIKIASIKETNEQHQEQN